MTAEKVTIYIRKSREGEDGQTETLFNQKESLIRFAEEKEYNYEIFEEIESSVDFNRPELVRMLAALETGEYRKILCTKIDRIGRETSILSEVKRICVKHNILIETPTTVYDLKVKNQKMMYNFSSLIAEAEYDEIRERLARGKVNSVNLRNRWIGSSPPFGYLYDKNDKKLKPHPDESKVFRHMVELALDGHSFSQIANKLNELGYKTQNNLNWTAGRILKILKNNTYLGYAEYNSTTVGEKAFSTNCHEPLMTEDEQRRIFVLSASRRNYDTRNWGHIKTALDGLVYCGKCKRGMSIQISKKKSIKRGDWYFYQARRCIHHNPDGTRCTNAGCKIDIIEDAVIEELQLYKKELEARLEELGNADTTGVEQELKNKVQQLEDDLKKQDTSIARAKKLYVSGNYTDKELEETLTEINSQKSTLTKEYEYLSKKLSNMDTAELTKTYNDIIDKIISLDDAPLEQKNRILKKLISRIELTKEDQYAKPKIALEYNN